MIYQSKEKLFFVMMAGLSGSGKTSLATRMGKATGWLVISKDLYKSSLIRCGTGMTDEETGRVAYELLFDQAEEFIVRQQLSIIFDTSAHSPFILEHATRIAEAANAEMKIIHCIAPGNIRLERLNERATANLHHPFMLQMATIAIEDEHKQFRHLPVDRLSIDTRMPLEICLAKCLQYVLQTERLVGK
jgi:predicted kinase